MHNSDDDIAFKAEMLFAVFSSSPDAIIIVDGNGIIQMANPQAELLFGYHHNELHGEPVELLLPEELWDAHRRHRASYLENPRIRPMGLHLKLNARKKTKALVPVDINLSPVVNEKRGLFIIVSIRTKRDTELRQDIVASPA